MDLWSISQFKTDLLVWLSATLEHLGVIGTGGIVVLLIQIAEKKWPHIFNWQTSRRVFLAFVMFAVFQSWESEYLSRIGREKDLIKARAEDDGIKRQNLAQVQSLRFQNESSSSMLRADCAVKDGINQTLQQQNRDEQVLIAGCQSQALKLLVPEELKVTVMKLEMEAPDQNPNAKRLVAIHLAGHFF